MACCWAPFRRLGLLPRRVASRQKQQQSTARRPAPEFVFVFCVPLQSTVHTLRWSRGKNSTGSQTCMGTRSLTSTTPAPSRLDTAPYPLSLSNNRMLLAQPRDGQGVYHTAAEVRIFRLPTRCVSLGPREGIFARPALVRFRPPAPTTHRHRPFMPPPIASQLRLSCCCVRRSPLPHSTSRLLRHTDRSLLHHHGERKERKSTSRQRWQVVASSTLGLCGCLGRRCEATQRRRSPLRGSAEEHECL